VELKTLPPVFTLHLKRFSFDFQRMRRVKLSNRFFLQETLAARDFLHESAVAGVGEDDGPAFDMDTEYELFAIMIHQGTAHGGHYFAYIKVRRCEDGV